jgi:hypothetical protein
MRDFFVSYTAADKEWAEWIAWILEDEGFSVTLQAWDFVPGSNFALEMQRGAATAQRTIAVLSPAYLTSRFAAPEWAAAFAKDPEGMKRSLVPVRIRECPTEGLLKTVVYIDLVGLDDVAARQALIDGVKATRAKPAEKPAFPGAPRGSSKVGSRRPAESAPAGGRAAGAVASGYMPKITKAATDRDERRFVKDAFDLVRGEFERRLAEFSQQHGNIDFDLTPVDAAKFTAEIFVNGDSRAQCKIWIGGMSGGNDIAYSGNIELRDNSFNESLTLPHGDGELALTASMGSFFGRPPKRLNLERLSPDDAAEYLWWRFASELER